MDGRILLIDKPAGLTSHDVVDRVRKAFRTRRVGHAGTLDPFATGLLIVGVGAATKELGKLTGLDKTYEATIRLGATSPTFDTESDFVETPPAHYDQPSPDDVERALARFRGGYDQRAPIHSAKKIGGKKLYDLARRGEATEEMRPVKHVEIPELAMTDYAWPFSRIRVTCSSGTYIRSLADDIGRELGCGGTLAALRRTRIGPYGIEDAVPLEALKGS